MRQHGATPKEQSAVYQKRRDIVCRGMDRLGWSYAKPRASMFVWARVAEAHLKNQSTIDFCMRMLDEARVALAPGRAVHHICPRC